MRSVCGAVTLPVMPWIADGVYMYGWSGAGVENAIGRWSKSERSESSNIPSMSDMVRYGWVIVTDGREKKLDEKVNEHDPTFVLIMWFGVKDTSLRDRACLAKVGPESK